MFQLACELYEEPREGARDSLVSLLRTEARKLFMEVECYGSYDSDPDKGEAVAKALV